MHVQRVRLPAVSLLLFFLTLTDAPVLYAQVTPPAPTRGLCVLASDIGRNYPVDVLLDLVKQGHFDPVVIDWAWITAHWPQTDFEAVNRFRAGLKAQGVEAPAMYRPRFTEKPTVPEQVRKDGSPVGTSGHRICFSSPEARQWGLSWGRKILEKCPGFEEIIVYCPANECQCPTCAAAKAADRDAPYKAVWRFLREAKGDWQQVDPGIKLGVVYFSEAHFWALGEGIFDIARPFIEIYAPADVKKEVAAAAALRGQLGSRLRACTAKITFGAEDKVPVSKIADFAREVQGAGLSYYLWVFDTAFLSRLYEPAAVAGALGLDWQAIGPPLERLGMGPERATALVLQTAQTRQYSALRPLEQASEDAVAAVAAIFEDESRPVTVRFAAGIGLGDTRSPRAIPPLLRHARDPNVFVREAAVMSLGYVKDETGEARKVLAELAESDPYQTVDAKTGGQRYPVREIARSALSRLASAAAPAPATPRADPAAINPPHSAPPGRVSFAEAMAGKVITIAVVGDVIRLQNTGGQLENLEFRHYYPVVDGEQLVLGRWLRAQTKGGEELPVAVAGVAPDNIGNLVHTLRLPRVPAGQEIIIQIHSLLARRDRPAPQGQFPIPPRDRYPAEVQPYLRATPAVPAEAPEARAVAEQLLAQSHDAYQVTAQLAAMMKDKKMDGKWEPGLSIVAQVLKHGGACCASAVTAAAILRAAGIPTQVTYTCPWSLIHGIIRVYLPDYGWVRMDATCGTGLFPLLQEERDLGLARLYDTPPEAEVTASFWGWPFMNREIDGSWPFRCGGGEARQVRLSPDQGYQQQLMASGNAVLGSVPAEGAWQAWDALVSISRSAVTGGATGEFTTVTQPLGGMEEFVAAAREQQRPGGQGDE